MAYERMNVFSFSRFGIGFVRLEEKIDMISSGALHYHVLQFTRQNIGNAPIFIEQSNGIFDIFHFLDETDCIAT